MKPMISCADIQAALSARLDGEPYEIDDDVIDAHVSECAECTAFLENAARLNRSLAFGATPVEIPDLQASILSTIEPEFRRQAQVRAAWVTASRVVLVLVAIAFVVQGLRCLQLNDPESQALALDAAAVRMTLAFGAFFAAWRPAAMASLAPMYGALFAFQVGLRLRELIMGTLSGSDVVFIIAVGVCALTLLAGWLGRTGAVLLRSTWKTLSAAPAS